METSGKIFLKMCNHVPVTVSCLRVTRYEQKPSQENAIKAPAPGVSFFVKVQCSDSQLLL